MRNLAYKLSLKLFGFASYLMNKLHPNQRKVDGKFFNAKWDGNKFVWIPRGE